MNTIRTPLRPLDWRLGGILLGLLATIAVALQGPLGVSTAYVTTEAAIAEAVAPGASQRLAYWKSVGASLTPEWFLVVGVVVGALASALLARRGRPASARAAGAVPSSWAARFGTGRGLRFAAAFGGGFLLLFGARLAGGCTSGHVIAGMSQLAVSGMVVAAGVFLTGIPVARALYGRQPGPASSSRSRSAPPSARSSTASRSPTPTASRARSPCATSRSSSSCCSRSASLRSGSAASRRSASRTSR
jgi:hypothetical protein